MFGHVLAALIALGGGVVLSRFGQMTGLIGFGLIILVTALSAGGALGFLFGIPRVAGGAAAMVSTAADAGGAASGTGSADPSGGADGLPRGRRLLDTNTNLEKVSDWLTTMLVGVGLTQLGNINGALVQFREFLARHAVIDPDGKAGAQADLLPAIGPLLLVAGVVLGFVYFYVFTRVVITPRFHAVEFDLANGSVVTERAAVRTIKEVAHTMPLDSAALRNVAASPAPTVADSLAVMFEALYQPGGYLNAIRIAKALRGTDAVKRPDYWFYLAAARGQHYKALDSADAAEREQARRMVMEAARSAVELDPSYRARLWLISDPDSSEDDLSDFRDDPEFRQIVRRK